MLTKYGTYDRNTGEKEDHSEHISNDTLPEF